MEHTVRRARDTDLRGIQRALANSWRVGYDGVIDETTLREQTADLDEFYPRERFADKLDDDRLACFVAISAGDVAGICTVNWAPDNTHEFVPSGAAQLRSLYPDPAYWRQGIDTTLYEAGVDWLRSLDETSARLYVEVLATNDRARGFYEAVDLEPYAEGTVTLYGQTYATNRLRQSIGDEFTHSHSVQ